jgi:hypothetical protein
MATTVPIEDDQSFELMADVLVKVSAAGHGNVSHLH